MVLALRSFLRIAADDKLLFGDTSQARENLANHLVDDLIQNVHGIASLPGALRLLAELSVAGVADTERIVQSAIGELAPLSAGRQGEPCTTVTTVNIVGKKCCPRVRRGTWCSASSAAWAERSSRNAVQLQTPPAV